MGPGLIGADSSPSSGGGGGGWSKLHLECVRRQITFVVHDFCYEPKAKSFPRRVANHLVGDRRLLRALRGLKMNCR